MEQTVEEEDGEPLERGRGNDGIPHRIHAWRALRYHAFVRARRQVCRVVVVVAGQAVRQSRSRNMLNRLLDLEAMLDSFVCVNGELLVESKRGFLKVTYNGNTLVLEQDKIPRSVDEGRCLPLFYHLGYPCQTLDPQSCPR